MALGISTDMIDEIRTALANAEPDAEFIPLPTMGGHFVSRSKKEHDARYAYLFSTDVDGASVHIYLRP